MCSPHRNEADQRALLQRVKQAVLAIEPEADVLLYGSRSRGDSQDESDWDFLVLVEGPVDQERTDRVRHALYEIEWDCGDVISSVVRSRRDWNSSRSRAMPFHGNVEREGMHL